MPRGQGIAFIVRSYLQFLCSSLFKWVLFLQCPNKYKQFLKKSILPIDGTLTGNTTRSEIINFEIT